MSGEDTGDSDAFAAEVCWHYFMNDMTQAQIARQLGVTRLRVNQAIGRARQSGMVRIEVDSAHLPRLASGAKIAGRFGLAEVIVVPSDPNRYDYHAPVGAALASVVSDRMRHNRWHRIGVSWGMTVQAAIDRMLTIERPEVEVISMIGGTSHGEKFNAFGIASGFAARLGARYSLLAAPVYLAPQVDRAAFLAQSGFRTQFEKFRHLDAAILTCSDVSSQSYLIRTGLPDGFDPTALTRDGAVGDVVGRFLDAKGRVIATALDQSIVGIDLDVMRRVPDRILAAAGPHKVAIIRAVLAAGLATTLITDDVTATRLLEASGGGNSALAG